MRISRVSHERRNARADRPATHKFDVGAHVTHRYGLRPETASFHVLRQLPDGGAGLQYRIKCDHDGHERVATEALLEPLPPGPSNAARERR
ncbi:MAG: hypothetical protein CTY15_14460 [Methylocystis sp.]|nr:MAG: hypothetical protein CTY15_14460 [Methylocystis sp.]